MGNACCSLYEDPNRQGTETSGQKPGKGFPSTIQPGSTAIGSKVYIYKQDPLLERHRIAWLPTDIRTGPLTDDVLIMGMNKAYRETDDQGNFLYDPRVDPDGFDAVNTLAVVQHVLWMYRRVLSLAKRRPLGWLWGQRPIQVYPHAGKDSNAYYSRPEKALKFFYFSDGVKIIYSCRSWDIVAHETGHAVLDALQPGWISSTHPQTGALHEAFGDITSIFSVLDQLDMCELVVAHTKGDLANRHNLLAALGEEFGRGVGRYYGLRNADEDLSISQASTEVHELSKVFTGAVYDVLVRIFTATIQISEYPPAETLYRAGRHLLSVFVLAVLDAPYKDATFEDVANLMIKKEPQVVFKGFMKDEFTRREVFDEWARPITSRTTLLSDRTVHACGTLKMCGMKLRGLPDGESSQYQHGERPSSLAGSNKGSLGHKSVKLNNHVQYADDTAPVPAPRSTSLGRKNLLQVNNEAVGSPSTSRSNDYRGNTEPRMVLRNPNYQDTTTSFKSRSLGYSSPKHVHIQDDSPASMRGSSGHRNAQSKGHYQENVSSFKGSLGLGQNNTHHRHSHHQEATSSFKGAQNHKINQPYQETASSFKESSSHRSTQPYQDNISSFKSSSRNNAQTQVHTYQNHAIKPTPETHPRKSQQHYKDNGSNYKNMHISKSYTQHNPTYQALANRLPPPPPAPLDTNTAHLEFPPPPPETDQIWENQSSNYPDNVNVFESTEI